jgi:hypothetical protein
MYMHA